MGDLVIATLTAAPRDHHAEDRFAPVVLVSAACLLGLVVLTVGFARPIDDFWLTLASGRAILSGQAYPFRALPFTFTPTVPDALNPQWAAQVAFAAMGGEGRAVALHALLISGGLALTAARVRHRASASVTVVILFLIVAVLAPHLDARPQSFSVFLLPACLVLLERYADRRWLPAAYLAVIAIWANLHGAFVVGQLAAFAWAVVAVIRRQAAVRAGVAVATAVAALVAPLVNPVGIDLLRYAYGLGGNAAIQRLATEWQPSWVLTPISLIFWTFLALTVFLRWRGRGSVGAGELLLGGSLVILAVLMVRAIPWAVLAGAPIVAADFDALVRRHATFSEAMTSPLIERVRRWRWIVAALMGALVVFQLFRPAVQDPRLYDGMPVALVNRLQEELPDAGTHPLINSQRWGGYLRWRLGDRVRTFVDGRLEVPTAGTWDWYLRLQAGDAAALRAAEERGVRWAVVSSAEEALVTLLEDHGWVVVYEDEAGKLLRR